MIFFEEFLHILVVPQHGFALITFEEVRHPERGSLSGCDPKQGNRLVVFEAAH
jgi:hypothetical protein